MSLLCPAFADSWHLYNDRAVSGASKDTVISYEAYLLFYQKVAAEVRRPPNLNEIASVWLRNLSGLYFADEIKVPLCIEIIPLDPLHCTGSALSSWFLQRIGRGS